MTLKRWHELQCGDGNDYGTSWCLEREEHTEKPFMVTYYRDGRISRRVYPDKEKGALKRIAEVLKAKKGISGFYQQGDPRGCALYILRNGDIPDGESASAYYSRGVAVCY